VVDKKIGILFLVLCCLLIAVVPVSAYDSYSGYVGSSAGWTSINYAPTNNVDIYTPYFVIEHPELSANSKSLVHFDPGTCHQQFDSNAPNSASTPFTFTAEGKVIASGTFGYQRNYNTAWPFPSEIGGYQYWIFDTWNTYDYTNAVGVAFNYSHQSVYDISMSSCGYSSAATFAPGTTTPPGAALGLGGAASNPALLGIQSGNYTYNYDQQIHNSFDVHTGGIGIQGTISKLGTPSRAIVTKADGTYLTSQQAVTTADFAFSALLQPIYIKVVDSNNMTYSTPLLDFRPLTPTVTPTTTVVPTTYPTNWTGQPTLVTPTPTYNPSTDFYITLNPTVITALGSMTGTIANHATTDLSSITGIAWQYESVGGINSGGDFFDPANPDNPLQFKKTGGTWYQYSLINSGFTKNVGTSIPNPLTLNPIGIGSFIAVCDISEGSKFTELRTPFQIDNGPTSDNNQITVRLQNGANGNSLPGEIDFYSFVTESWINTTSLSDGVHFPAPINSRFTIVGKVNGYGEESLRYQSATKNGLYVINMFDRTTGDISANGLNVHVTSNGQPVAGAFVTVTNLSGTLDKRYGSTNMAGIASFDLQQSQVIFMSVGYKITATGIQYNTVEKLVTFDENSVYPVVVNLELGPVITFNPSATPTPPPGWATPTPTIHVQPTITQNGTGFWSPFYKSFTAMGADPATVNMLIAACLIGLFAIIGAVGAGMGGQGPTGFSAGASLGFLFSCAFGLIFLPLALIAIVWFLCSFFLWRS
jgi:hypothetical protein